MMILIAGILGNGQSDVSIHFMSMMLRVQQQLARSQGMLLSFELFQTENEALAFFKKNTSIDICVFVDTECAVDEKFLLEHDPSKAFVVAAYPLRTINWDRVKTSLEAHSNEDIHLLGNEYNIKLPPGVDTMELVGGRYLKIESAQLKICKFSREFLTTHPNPFFAPTPEHSAHDRLCLEWPGDIWLDMTAHTLNAGPVDYVGCVGTRAKLR